MTLRMKKIYCLKYQERVEKLSQQRRLIKFCNDSRFLTTVAVGQHFLTKKLQNSHNLQNQWLVVVSTLRQETKVHLNQNGWIRGNTPWTRIGCQKLPVTINMEWKLELKL